MSNFCQLWLTCKDEREADKIGKALLRKRLIACYGKLKDYGGEYWWHGKIERNNETFLEMLSREDLFDQVQKEVAKIHSYDLPVLLATPIQKTSIGVTQWLKKELSDGS